MARIEAGRALKLRCHKMPTISSHVMRVSKSIESKHFLLLFVAFFVVL